MLNEWSDRDPDRPPRRGSDWLLAIVVIVVLLSLVAPLLAQLLGG